MFFEKPRQKFDVLFAFIRDGLEKGETVCYHTFTETKDQLLSKLKKFGIDVDRFLKENRLLIVVKNKLPTGPMFNKDGTANLENFRKALESGVQLGSGAGFRLACTAPEHTLRRGIPEQQVELEKVMQEVTNGQMSVLCAYDSSRLKGEKWRQAFPEVTKQHSYALFFSAKGALTMPLPGRS